MKTEEINDSNVQPKGTWEQVTIGGIAGIAFGVGAAMFTNARTAQDENHEAKALNPIEPDAEASDAMMATCVDDDMTFGQAFSAARAEVGPGGVFEWHGRLYGTYTADEWNRMTAEQHDNFSNHLSWTPRDSQPSTSATDNLLVDNELPIIEENPSIPADTSEKEAAPAVADDEVEILAVNYEASTIYINNQDFVMVEVDHSLDDFTPAIENVDTLDNGPDYINNAPVEDYLS